MRLSTFALAAAAASALYSGSASAYIISTTQSGSAGNPSQPLYQTTIALPSNGSPNPADDYFDVKWKVPAGSGTQSLPFDLTAEARFTILNFTDDTLQFKIDITNTTQPTSGPAGILAFGFGITPNVTTAAVPTTADGNLNWEAEVQSPQQNFPGGFKNIDICVWADNTCSGGGQFSGLAAGASDQLTLTLTGATNTFDGTSKGYALYALLSDFPLKFQTDFGSFEVPGSGGGGGCTSNCGGGGGNVPEPTSIALFGLGMVALRMNRRRRMA